MKTIFNRHGRLLQTADYRVSTFGDPTKSTFKKEVDSHGIHHAFTVQAGQSVKKGQPVELHTNGTVRPVTSATFQTTCIGIALMDRAAGEEVTVATFGHSIIRAKAKTALNAGPVFYDSYDGTLNLLVYDDTSVTAANIAGWSLESAAAADEEILVLQRH